MLAHQRANLFLELLALLLELAHGVLHLRITPAEVVLFSKRRVALQHQLRTLLLGAATGLFRSPDELCALELALLQLLLQFSLRVACDVKIEVQFLGILGALRPSFLSFGAKLQQKVSTFNSVQWS